MTLTAEEFEAEKRYQFLMALVRRMLSEGLLSVREYTQIAAGYAERISPPTGDLLAANGLLFSGKRGDAAYAAAERNEQNENHHPD